jgi:hypothetical protein
VHVRLVDDLDRSEASQTVIFGLDWRVYEVELSEENARRAPRRPRPVRQRCSSKRHRRWPSATLQRGWWLAAVTLDPSEERVDP